LLYPLVYQHFDTFAAQKLGASLAMLTDFTQQWQAEHVKWVDAVIRTVVAESAHNQQLVATWAAHYAARAQDALRPLAAVLLDGDECQERAAPALDDIASQFAARLAKLGAQPCAAPETTASQS
jgi:phenol/toluene 2-monooxygenase (NADH) P1/A1